MGVEVEGEGARGPELPAAALFKRRSSAYQSSLAVEEPLNRVLVTSRPHRMSCLG